MYLIAVTDSDVVYIMFAGKIMNLTYRAVCRITGLVLLVIGFSMVPSLCIAIADNETEAVYAFLGAIIFGCLAGYILYRYGHKTALNLRIRDGFFIVSLCWFVSALLGTVPFFFSGSIPNFIDAFFESCSGLSTTGASILTDIEALPRSILFWRSFTHWPGGMGILVFAIALMPSLGISGQNLVAVEAPGPTRDKLTPKMTDTAKTIYAIYISLTLLLVILLKLGGMSSFDAFTHAFSTMGTGGFSNYNDSIAHFGSVYIDLVITVFMILAGINFNLYFLALRHGPRQMFRDGEFRFYLCIIVAVTLLITGDLLINNVYDNAGDAARYSLVHTTSVLTTTGFASADYNLWPTFSKMLLMLLMFVGGSSSSTSGGVKVIRILILLKLIRRGMATRLHPNAVVTVRLNNRIVPSETVTAITGYVFLYMVLVFVSTLLLSLNGFDMVTNFTSVFACIGNIGPGFGLTGPAGNFSMFAPASKLLLSFLMLAGRLELFSLLMLFTPQFWKDSH